MTHMICLTHTPLIVPRNVSCSVFGLKQVLHMLHAIVLAGNFKELVEVRIVERSSIPSDERRQSSLSLSLSLSLVPSL